MYIAFQQNDRQSKSNTDFSKQLGWVFGCEENKALKKKFYIED